MLGLVGLGVLTVVLTLVFSTLRDKQTPEVSLSPLESPTLSERSTAEPSPTVTPTNETFKSPLPTPTKLPTLPPSPTPLPTSTRPPEPPTRAPTPTYTPAPPTPTPEPLPTLIPGLQTIVYATTGDKGPEIYRAQVNETGIVEGSIYLAHTTDLLRDRTYLDGLHPSPDGRQIAVSWVYGEGGQFISLLDVSSGWMLPLFGKEAEIDQRAIFLDWSPDGDSVLILGGIGNPDLSGGVWLVDVHTHEYQHTGIQQEDYSFQEITSASLSPDGTLMAYTRQDYAQNAGEIWRVSLDGSERQILIKDSGFRVEDVLWSPDGKHIAFTRWQESTDYHDFTLGELWVMNADGSEQRRLSPAVTGYYKRFLPAWSPDSSRIAFIQGSGSGRDLAGLASNAYVVDIQSGAIRELTSFQNMQVLKPVWSPDGSRMTFVVSQAGSLGQFEPWIVTNDGRDLRRIDTSVSLVIDSRKSNPIVVWLPALAAER